LTYNKNIPLRTHQYKGTMQFIIQYKGIMKNKTLKPKGEKQNQNLTIKNVIVFL